MRKQVLVSVDRGETRVALMEATGAPAARLVAAGPGPAQPARRRERQRLRHQGRSQDQGRQRRLARRRALPRAPRQPLDRRQHLQGQGRQRPARAGGRVRRHRPRQERLPARRRDRHPRRRGRASWPRRLQGQVDRRAAQARPGGRRPGRQGPLEDQGRAPVDGPDDRRPLHGLHARPARASASPSASTTRSAIACAARPRASTCTGGGAIVRTAAHGASAPGLRARAAVPLQAPRGPRQARRRDRGARRWSSRRPTCRCASCATSSARTSRRRSSTTSSSSTGSSRSSAARLPSWSTASSSGRSPSPCSRPGTSRRSSTA